MLGGRASQTLAFVPSQILVVSCQFALFLIKVKSSLFSHKLRKAEMLMLTVGTVRGCFSADGGPAAALGGAPR